MPDTTPIHTLDLPNRNRTTDAEINAISTHDERVVITKDADFVNSFLLFGRPHKLLLISTGNITNIELEAVFIPKIQAIVAALGSHSYVEVSRTALVVHQ